MATFRLITSFTVAAPASFVPVAGDFVVVCVYAQANANTAPTCADDNGGTYTLVTAQLKNASADTLSIFVRDTQINNTTATTVTPTVGSASSVRVTVVCVSAMLRFGIGAVRQNAVQANQAASTTPAPSFNTAALTTNLTLGAVAAATTLTAPTNWTLRDSSGQLQVDTRDSGFSGTTITWGSTDAAAFAAIIIELDASTPPGAIYPHPFAPPYVKPGQFAKTQWNGPREVVAGPIDIGATISLDVTAPFDTPQQVVPRRPFGRPWERPGQFGQTSWNGPREVVGGVVPAIAATVSIDVSTGIDVRPAVFRAPFSPPWIKPGQFARTRWNGPREVVGGVVPPIAATVSIDARGYNAAKLKPNWWGPWFPKRGRHSWWDGWFPEAKGSLVLALIPTLPVVDPSTGAGAATLALVLQAGAKVTYGYDTDVNKPQHGNEFRASNLTRPKERYKGSAFVVGDDVRSLRTLIARYAPLGSAFLLGLPHEGVTIVASSVGLVVTVGSTANLDWAAPGMRVVCVGPDRTQRAEGTIQAVSATTFTLDAAPGAAGAIGGAIMPAVPVYLDPQTTFDRYAPAEPVESWQISARAAGFGFVSSSVRAVLVLSTVSTSGVLAGLVMIAVTAGALGATIQLQHATLGVGVNMTGAEDLVARTVLIQFRAGVATVQDLVNLVGTLALVRMEGTYNLQPSSTIVKTGGTGADWDGGAASVQKLTGDGYVETLIAETNTYRMLGLSYVDTNLSYTAINYAFYVTGAGAGVSVFESGVNLGGFAPYSAGDRLRVRRTGTTITYEIVKPDNTSSVFYTSLTAVTGALLIDTTFLSAGATLQGVRLFNAGTQTALTWQNAATVTITTTNPSTDLLSIGTDEFGPTAMTGGRDAALAAMGTGALVTYYQLHPLWDRGLVTTGTSSDSIQTLTQVVDMGGLPLITADSDQADWGRRIVITSNRPGEFQWFKAFLDNVRGKQHAFWLPTYRADIVVVSHTGTTIVVSSTNLVSWFDSPFFRSQVAVIQVDGTMTPAQILTSVDNGDGTFTLTIPLTSFLSGVAISALSWLELVRLETDDVEVSFDGATFKAELQARVVQS